MTDKLSTDVTHHNKLDTPDAATQDTKSQRRCSSLRICEVLVLTLVMLAILGLFLIPTVYYATYEESNHTITAHPDGYSYGNQLVCSDGFYFDEDETRLCRPICGEINPKHIGLQILENASICICFIASVLMFILALSVQKDSL